MTHDWYVRCAPVYHRHSSIQDKRVLYYVSAGTLVRERTVLQCVIFLHAQ